MSISWCKKQGMRLIDPNGNLAEEYYRNAEETLMIANTIKDSGSNMWLATQKYYAEYLLAYSVLMKIGVKTEIHSCTIDVIRMLERQNLIRFGFSKLLEDDKELRIDNQYYLKNRPVDFDSERLSEIFLMIRKLLDTISREDIDAARKCIKNS